ncbi:MAG: hypothetical protein ABH851_09405 [Methanobacteriota archaeon]
MKKIILVLISLIALTFFVSANGDDDYMMEGYGMMGGMGSFGVGLIALIYLAVAAFIVSVIFWWTYKLIVKKDEK